MIKIANGRTPTGERVDLEIASTTNEVIDANNLIVFPGLVDPHVHFRTPGLEHKEDWRTAAKAAIRGGYTTVFDMPNTVPPTVTKELLDAKKHLINAQLQEVGIPLRYQLFFGADKNHLSEIHKTKNEVVGIKIFMGCSTGNMQVDDETMHAIFAIASDQNMLVAVHAEDQELIHKHQGYYSGYQPYNVHSKIRNEEVAARAVEKAISLARLYGTKLYLLHVSTQDEIALIKQAKQERLAVYAETTPHHLFLDDSYYADFGGKVVVNPPIRSKAHQAALFNAIHEGIIDTIGSDHAPHTIDEKSKPYGECPSGMPGIETTLPLLLNAHHEGLLMMHEIVGLTSKHAQDIFNLAPNFDVTLVDPDKEVIISDAQLKTKCGWSAFSGRKLRGAPVYTIVDGHLYDLENF